MLTKVQKEHGSRAKLIDAIAQSHKRDKDKDYRAGLEQKATPELYQILVSSKKRNKPKSN